MVMMWSVSVHWRVGQLKEQKWNLQHCHIWICVRRFLRKVVLNI